METKSINKNNNKKDLQTNKPLLVDKKNKKKISLDEENKMETNGNICKYCFKPYKSRTGLWKHLKKCNQNISTPQKKV